MLTEENIPWLYVDEDGTQYLGHANDDVYFPDFETHVYDFYPHRRSVKPIPGLEGGRAYRVQSVAYDGTVTISQSPSQIIHAKLALDAIHDLMPWLVGSGAALLGVVAVASWWNARSSEFS
jgi:hypothetical protein